MNINRTEWNHYNCIRWLIWVRRCGVLEIHTQAAAVATIAIDRDENDLEEGTKGIDRMNEWVSKSIKCGPLIKMTNQQNKQSNNDNDDDDGAIILF